MRHQFVTALLLVAPWATAAALQDTTTKQMPPTDTIRGQMSEPRDGLLSDNDVLLRMHETNQREIRLGRLAQRNGGTGKVKSYGAQLARDHAAADKKVTALARKLGVSLTDMPHGRAGHMQPWSNARADTSQYADTTGAGRFGQRADTIGNRAWNQQADTGQGAADEARLASLRGAEFDAAFANAMVTGHEQTISALEQAQGQVQSAELRTLISSTLPTVRRHLQIAQSLGGITTTTSSIQQ